MSVVRVNKTEDYTIMSNNHFKQKNMSLKAKGLLSEMLSLPDDWDYSIKGLVSINKENECSIKSTLDELKKFGYVKVTKIMPNKTKTGRIEYIYDIFENPKQEGEKQGVENQGVEFQGVENQGQLIINNKELKNKIINSRFIPPTLEEIKQYCEERNNNVDYQKFYDYYSVSKWKDKDGKQVKNWKQKIITWEGRNKKSEIIPDWYKKDYKKEELDNDELQEMNELMKDFR